MNKKDHKRYNKLKEEISGLNQDIEDAENILLFMFRNRNMNGVAAWQKTISKLQYQLCQRRIIMEELLLLKHLVIEDGYTELVEFCEDNNWELTKELIEEYISNYLMDNYNRNIYGFQYGINNGNIYVNAIRWNEHQILKEDVKTVVKGDAKEMGNEQVHLIKTPHFKNGVVINHDGYSTRVMTYKEAIKYLEDNYYM